MGVLNLNCLLGQIYMYRVIILNEVIQYRQEYNLKMNLFHEQHVHLFLKQLLLLGRLFPTVRTARRRPRPAPIVANGAWRRCRERSPW